MAGRYILSRCSRSLQTQIVRPRIQICQQRFASTPTTIDDRPSDLETSFESERDTIDEMLESDELEQLYGASPPSSTTTTTTTTEEPITSTLEQLSEKELLRRRDRVNKTFESLGSTIQPHYTPRQALFSPPDMASVGIAALAAAQAHMGHATSLWNPLTQPYIYGVRDGIHLFNLDITMQYLKRASDVIKGIAKADGIIVFVGTRAGQKRSVVEAAARAGGFHIFDRWVPGTITNGKQVVGAGRVKNLVTKHKRNRSRLENPSAMPNSIVPDLVVILNPLENTILMSECAKARVPTIGIIDSDMDPRAVTYAIPANDDSVRCTTLIAGVLSRAAQAGRAEMQMSDWEQVEVGATNKTVTT